MTIVVAGATGTVGRQLVDQLLAAGHPVRALTRNPVRADLPEDVEVVAGDLADTGSLAGLFDGATAAHLITFDGADFSPLTGGSQIAKLAIAGGVRAAGRTGIPNLLGPTGTLTHWNCQQPSHSPSNNPTS
ncbi:SDR family oxidoreductase [Saccharopolyspora sp. 5N708]|uniref:SDR family oxidoreductase n=1 Tax=Saccharopolyspora sp. 5N708 TaxID=3457424 RepID=UPI003FD609EE